MNLSKGFKILSLLVVICAICLVFFFDLHLYFSFENLKANLDSFKAYYVQNKFLTISIYMALYISISVLSLPFAGILTLLGGALFGFFAGIIIVSFSSSIGALLSFLFSRYMFKNFVEQKFHSTLLVINKGIKKKGLFYLFALRLVPVLPFFILNPVMGLTNMRTIVFYFVTQLGMLPATIVFVNAGLQLAKINSVSNILSFDLILAFAVLGVFPLAAKLFLEYFE